MAIDDSVIKHVQLNKRNVDKLYELYGSDKLSWTLDMLLEAFIDAHQVTPQELAIVGAKQLKKLLAEGGK